MDEITGPDPSRPSIKALLRGLRDLDTTGKRLELLKEIVQSAVPLAAKAIGLTIPPSLLLRADQVIE